MHFLSAAHSDIGTTKQNNQDSLCLKIAETKLGEVAFAVVSDGMGGLKKGELASATVIRAFSDWFDKVLPNNLGNTVDLKQIAEQWSNLISSLNYKIAEYGIKTGIQLGTTICAIIVINGKALVCNVGDSRAYSLGSNVIQITKDHSVIAMEIETGRLTKEQAKFDPRRSVLTQCIGASQKVTPDFYEVTANPGTAFAICSDGFVHEISNEEIFSALNPSSIETENAIKPCLIDLVERVKSRGEKDNISVVYIKNV